MNRPWSELCSNALSIKVLRKLPLRQRTGMVASLRQMAGLDWPVPDYSAGGRTLLSRSRIGVQTAP